MNILFLLPEYYPHSGGGISTYYINYINALKPFCNRVKVIVGSAYTQKNQAFVWNEIEIEYLNPAIFNKYQTKFTKLDLYPGYKNNIAAAWAMWDQSHQGHGFDIIECTDFGLGFVPWVIEHDKPVITRLHGSTGQIALYENAAQDQTIDAIMQVELSLFPLCDYLITHSTANQDFWSKILPLAKIKYLLPIYQIENTQYVPHNERSYWGLVTARLQKWKGPIELCEALISLKKSVKVRWIGRDMAYTSDLSTAQYVSNQYAEIWNTFFLYELAKPNKEIRELQEKALFGIVSSTWDMFNFTGLEFLSSGTLLICSDGAGISDIIINGVNGFKYPANDAKALARYIEKAIELDATAYAKIVEEGFKTIDQLLSGKELIPINLMYYENALKVFKQSSSNDFLQRLYRPADVVSKMESVLDKQPLKRLIKYICERCLKKLFKISRLNYKA